MIRFLPAVLLLVAPSFAPAEGPSGVGQERASEPKTRMSTRGELLWHEKFEDAERSKAWSKGLGTWAVEGGVLKGAERPEDKHQAYTSRKVAASDAIIQFSFKFEGARLVGAYFDGKGGNGKPGHICAVSISADSIRLFKMPKWEPVGSAKASLNDGNWHTLVWEVRGNEMAVTVDDKHTVDAKVEGLSTERDHVELNTRGGQWGLFKDLKVWKAEPKKD